MLPLFCLACPLSSQPRPSSCERIKAAWKAIDPLPYVWGGESRHEGGVDCSGAIFNVQKRIGRPVPRTTARKYFVLASGERKGWREAGCGDWIWWTFKPSRPHGHIGMHVELPFVWQSGSSTGPERELLFEGGFWDRYFDGSKSVGLQ